MAKREEQLRYRGRGVWLLAYLRWGRWSTGAGAVRVRQQAMRDTKGPAVGHVVRADRVLSSQSLAT